MALPWLPCLRVRLSPTASVRTISPASSTRGLRESLALLSAQRGLFGQRGRWSGSTATCGHSPCWHFHTRPIHRQPAGHSPCAGRGLGCPWGQVAGAHSCQTRPPPRLRTHLPDTTRRGYEEPRRFDSGESAGCPATARRGAGVGQRRGLAGARPVRPAGCAERVGYCWGSRARQAGQRLLRAG